MPEPVDDRVFAKVHSSLLRFLQDVGDDPEHELRAAFDERVRLLADDLAHSPDMRVRAEALKDELIDHCRTLLAGFKCPRTVIFTELPKTSTGKIQKHVLRDQAKAL